MSISTIRRQVKNVAYNFSDAQVKVREATSNDPWGPSTALMSEIADLTNNSMAFTEIMMMIWKRLNDSGKNWRHVYKSLVLLDFLVKCGNEKVAQQCRENIYTIETLKDFQYIEDAKDQGLNIREKAKVIVTLLADEEKLKNERTRFMLTRSKFRQNNSVGYSIESRNRRHTESNLDPEFEEARPSTATEEDLQLQIALALSREEHEKAQELRKNYDAGLQIAIEESKKEAEKMSKQSQGTVHSGQLTQSALDDLLSLGVGELVSGNEQPTSSAFGGMDPWAPSSTPAVPTQSIYPQAAAFNDPWAPAPAHTSIQPFGTQATADPFVAWDNQTVSQPIQQTPTIGNNEIDLLGGDLLAPTTSTTNNGNGLSAQINPNRKTPENFLGENSNLVNLDNLLGTSTAPTNTGNPFLTGTTSTAATANPFTAQQRKSPTLNEMRAAQGQAPPIPASAPRGGLPQAVAANPFASPF